MYSMSTLSPRRSAILTFIRDRIAQQGQSPSLAEISEAFGFASRSVARKHIVALAEAGLIEVVTQQARLLNSEPRPELLEIPVLGRVAAGAPIGPDLDIHSTLHLDRGTFTRVPDYLLRVQGDSMIEDGILDRRPATGRSSSPVWTAKSPSSACSTGAISCTCCRATRRINRSSSRPIRTSPSKACSAGWCGANDGRRRQPRCPAG